MLKCQRNDFEMCSISERKTDLLKVDRIFVIYPVIVNETVLFLCCSLYEMPFEMVLYINCH